MQVEGQELADAIEFVTLGYGDLLRDRAFRSLHFRTDRLTTRQAQIVLRLVKSHNAFEGEKVAVAIDAFYRRVSWYEFGRETSPVLYIELPYTENQIEEHTSHIVGTRIVEDRHEALLRELEQMFHTLNADEFSVDERRHRVRAWWD
jgi:hypothetical protein